MAFILPTLVVIGLIDAWSGRASYVAGDAVSYMDKARSTAAGDLRAAVNEQRSPSIRPLAAAIRWAEPDSLIEFSIVRGINFLIFLGPL